MQYCTLLKWRFGAVQGTVQGRTESLIGREAFSSSKEFAKTVLHELHRLTTSASSNGVSHGLAASETKATFEFAERAIEIISK